MTDPVWIFTFGHGQDHFGKYVRISGDFATARARMFDRFDDRWSMQYDAEKGAEVIARWNLTELP